MKIYNFELNLQHKMYLSLLTVVIYAIVYEKNSFTNRFF